MCTSFECAEGLSYSQTSKQNFLVEERTCGSERKLCYFSLAYTVKLSSEPLLAILQLRVYSSFLILKHLFSNFSKTNVVKDELVSGTSVHATQYVYNELEHALRKSGSSLQTKTLHWRLQKSHQWLDMLRLHADACSLNLYYTG